MVPYLGLGLGHVSDCTVEWRPECSPVRAEPQPDAPISGVWIEGDRVGSGRLGGIRGCGQLRKPTAMNYQLPKEWTCTSYTK